MDPITTSVLLNSAKILWGKYQEVEAQNKGMSSEQLRYRIDSLDDVVRQNFKIIEKLSAQVQSQKIQLLGLYLLTFCSLAIVAYIALKS